MQKALLFLIILIAVIVITPFQLIAQNNLDRSVRVSAVVTESPASITLNWVLHADATGYTIYRKAKGASFWGSPKATLTGTTNTWTDNAVIVGNTYEYRIDKSGGAATGYGYILSGIKVAATHSRGKMLLLIDDTYTTPLATEIDRLIADMRGDGWQVIRKDISRTLPVPDVKDIIKTEYNADPTNFNTLFILGHIAVPYSGNIYPDGHPDHQGAWPADVYYAEMNSTWTDVTVNNTVANRPENDNIPDDGKFDQSAIPSDVELQVGRVDVYNMPSINPDDVVLMKQYLNKNHAFRTGAFTVQRRGLVDDNFMGYNIAITGLRNFPPMFDAANVVDNYVNGADYVTLLTAGDYLFTYGCGGGWYQGASGVASTGTWATDSLKTVFTSLAGSYFGDWDNADAFLRAPLASKSPTLINFWGGIPHWPIHYFAMGDPIGLCTKLSQNNGGLYDGNFNGAQRSIHIALMGDPTLRLHNMGMPTLLTATPTLDQTKIDLSWTAATGSILGYHIYRTDSLHKAFTLLNTSPVTGTTYQDVMPKGGQNIYMVRAVLLENSASGTYHNLSTGTISNAVNLPVPFLKIKTLLQGPYAGGGQMNATLKSKDLIPLAQPYNIAPWNYAGTENTALIPSNVVDWVLVELRSKADSTVIRGQKACFIKTDGQIVDANNNTELSFPGLSPGENVFIALRHRNHLAVLSKTALAFNNASSHNLSLPANILDGGTQLANLGDGYYGLKAGDCNANGTITVADFNIYSSQASQIAVYKAGDCNLDGNVTISDFNKYQPNTSAIAVAVVRY